MRKVKKAKKSKRVEDGIRLGFNTRQKSTGELWTRVIKKKTKTDLLLAWQIQKAEANY